jgi:hypothetical protein
VVALRAFVFGCKVTKSRNVSRISMDVKNNFMAEVQKAQTPRCFKEFITCLLHDVIQGYLHYQ